jgi:hypothetical protein
MALEKHIDDLVVMLKLLPEEFQSRAIAALMEIVDEAEDRQSLPDMTSAAYWAWKSRRS